MNGLGVLLRLLIPCVASLSIRVRRTDERVYGTAEVDNSSLARLKESLTSEAKCHVSSLVVTTKRCQTNGEFGGQGDNDCTQVVAVETDDDTRGIVEGDAVDDTFDKLVSSWRLSTTASGNWRHSEFSNCLVPNSVPQDTNHALAAMSGGHHHAAARSFPAVSTAHRDFVVHFQVKLEKDPVSCGHAYLKLYQKGMATPQLFADEYALMFGIEYCPQANRSLVLHFNGRARLLAFQHPPVDLNAHSYTLVVHANSTFRMMLDGHTLAAGSLDPNHQLDEGQLESLHGGAPFILAQLDRPFHPMLYSFEHLSVLGLEVSQDQAATIFDNIMLSSSLLEVLRFSRRTAWPECPRGLPSPVRAHTDHDKVLKWYQDSALQMGDQLRAQHATVLVAASNSQTTDGQILCPYMSLVSLADEQGVITVAVNQPDPEKVPQAVYLARLKQKWQPGSIQDDMLSSLNMVALLAIDQTCCLEFNQTVPGVPILPAVPYRSKSSFLQPGSQATVSCMNSVYNQEPTRISWHQVQLLGWYPGQEGVLFQVLPSPPCSGGMVYDSSWTLIGVMQRQGKQPSAETDGSPQYAIGLATSAFSGLLEAVE
eukprot:gene10942-1988_t